MFRPDRSDLRPGGNSQPGLSQGVFTAANDHHRPTAKVYISWKSLHISFSISYFAVALTLDAEGEAMDDSKRYQTIIFRAF